MIWAPSGQRASQISERSRSLFRAAAQNNLHLATFQFPTRLVGDKWKDVVMDQESVTMLRSCLMKPEHEEWIDRIWDILDRVAE